MSQIIRIPVGTPVREANAVAYDLYTRALALDPLLVVLGGNRFRVSDEAAEILLSGADETRPAPKPRKAAAKRPAVKKAPAKRAAKKSPAPKKAAARKSAKATEE